MVKKYREEINRIKLQSPPSSCHLESNANPSLTIQEMAASIAQSQSSKTKYPHLSLNPLGGNTLY